MSAIAAIGSVNLTKPILVTLIHFGREFEAIGSFGVLNAKASCNLDYLNDAQIDNCPRLILDYMSCRGSAVALTSGCL